MDTSDRRFDGSIPAIYERELVPLIFQPYADDLAARAASIAPARVLEIAAGTGVATRALAARLPASTTIVATDLNAAMLEHARGTVDDPRISWRQADAMALPFDDGAFDLVVCQFGAMFFPDKALAFAEARRVLVRGGRFLFNVWDRIETNELTRDVVEAAARLLPGAPPDFLARIPHGYHDVERIRRDLADAGFTSTPYIDTLAFDSRAPSARVVANAFCQGTPMRNEIEARDGTTLERVTDGVTAALVERYGRGPVAGRIQAHVVAIVA